MLHFFFFNDTATTEIYTLSLHDALPICVARARRRRARSLRLRARTAASASGAGGKAARRGRPQRRRRASKRSEEHTSELQSRQYLVCRLLFEKKKKKTCRYLLIQYGQR